MLMMQTLALIVERSGNEPLEQRMGAVGTALELGMELDADVELTVGQLHSLHQTAIGTGTGNDQTLLLHFLAEVTVELIAMALALADLGLAVAGPA